jgi:hypothetical protein
MVDILKEIFIGVREEFRRSQVLCLKAIILLIFRIIFKFEFSINIFQSALMLGEQKSCPVAKARAT